MLGKEQILGLRTAEFVTPQHPDKVCDYIADSILDAHLARDLQARVAVEVMGGHGLVTLNGEITSTVEVDYSELVKSIVGGECKVLVNIAAQSPEISAGVDTGGAGDQGIMVGYASSETESLMPKEYETARGLCQEIFKEYPHDGKVQVTLAGDAIKCVIASFQTSDSEKLEKLVRSLVKADLYLINPAGEWSIGGFDADSGLSGRKLVVDNYGPQVPLGGGSFSGKDYTKVDRSGAYIARKVAVDLLNKQGAREVLVKLAYAIGVSKPVMAVAFIDGIEADITQDYDFTPKGIASALNLQKPIFAQTCQWGHFGRGFDWDKSF